MAGTGSQVGKRIWMKIAIGLTAGIVLVGSLAYWRRYDLAVWYLKGNKTAQEAVILQVVEMARPIIEKEFRMDLTAKIYSAIAGLRNEKERQAGALKDVRTFCQLNFENHKLQFKDVHRLASLNGFKLQGYDLALTWNRGNADEVVMAFVVNFLKREIGRAQINENNGFFSALRLYIEKKAQEN